MCAQRAHCEAVNSYEGESTPVDLLIRADKLAFDESGVGMEAVASLLSRHGVHTRAAEHSIDLADNAGEVRYGGRITPFGVGARGICRNCGAVDGAWEIPMRRGAKRRRMGIDYRERLPTATSLTLTLIVTLVVIRARGRPKPRAEDSSGCGLEKLTAAIPAHVVLN